MPSGQRAAGNLRVQIIANFVAVYLIWGSTYLAIRFADKTMPPLLMAGTRFFIAGIVLYLFMRLRGTPRPSLINWRSTAIVGLFLLVGGNGMVVLAEQTVPSSLAALLISITPIWMALLDWLRPGGLRPTWMIVVGLIIGFLGVGLLIGPEILNPGPVSIVGLIIIPLAALSWATGSIFARQAPMPKSPLLGTGMEMIAGGVILTIISFIVGEPAQVNLAAISGESWIAYVYLITFGSLIGFSAYVWLLNNVPLAQASTYAYVNPAVAVFLGWALAGEQLTPLTLIAASVIVGSVVLITTSRNASPKAKAAPSLATLALEEETAIAPPAATQE